MKTTTLILATVASLLSASTARAALTNLSIVENADGTIPGYVVNDLYISFTGEWRGTQLLTSVMPGQIYQHPNGGNTPPNGALLGVFPDLAFDTFMANGGKTAETDGGVLEVGASVNMGGNGSKKFDTDQIDVTWAPQIGTHPTDLTDHFIGRFTLSENAYGSYIILVATGGENKILERSFYQGRLGWSDPLGRLVITSFWDRNYDGIYNNNTDAPLPDWTFRINDNWNLITNEMGNINISLPAGEYTITEIAKEGWVCTSPNPITVTIEEDKVTLLPFANIMPSTGDFNLDGVVDQLDLSLLLTYWGRYPDHPSWKELSDSVVSQNELNALLVNWGKGTGSGQILDSATVPEPATLMLLALVTGPAAWGSRSR